MILENYKSLIFDCDGVVLNSNSIKTDAFAKISMPYGNHFSNKLVEYHKKNGGISRYKKIEYFVDEILDIKDKKYSKKLWKTLCENYSELVFESLIQAEVASGLGELRQITKYSDWMIVSGGDQNELRKVFDKKSIAYLFNKGIYGSPKSKYKIIQELLLKKSLDNKSLFVGDSKLDYEVANHYGIDFVFVSSWSEFDDLNEFAKVKGIKVYKKLININD
tara:strand:- start:254 stop:913 length:660 start_codon:yes stop_codon:yes gene_type:complete